MSLQPATLDYLIQEKEQVEKNNQYIYVEVVPAYEMPSAKVERTRTLVLPFIVYFRIQADYLCSLDLTCLREDPNEFLKTGFLREGERNCVFNFTEVRDSANYLLQIQLDSLGGWGTVQMVDETIVVPVPFGYGFSITTSSATMENAASYNSMSFRLSNKKGEIIMKGTYVSERPIPDHLQDRVYLWPEKLYPTTTAILAEGLSESYRSNFKAIIKDLNEVAQPQAKTVMGN